MELKVPTLEQVAAMMGEDARRATGPMPGSNALLREYRNIEDAQGQATAPPEGGRE